ncbi:HD-GYP domain-containing protein [Desulfatirhabdium butyrativorans]|uniref:HD-GYP domain-containing protein n=1 Tax=Desulfatirhabdium butyrativorans TaxID=340467 RepID=UPI00041E9EFB|nr:response regulator [Desulfatirhabdium butyrativorans]
MSSGLSLPLPAGRFSGGEPLSILVVDDNPVTRSVLALKLRQWGYRVAEAENGISAWELLQSSPIQMVITDWMMPDMDGMALSRRIREEITSRYTYIIVVSALDSKPDILKGLQAGIDDYLVKPIDFDHLQARMAIGKRILDLEKGLLVQNELIQQNYFQTIRMVTHLMEAFDEELGGHCRRVGQLARTIGQMHPDVHEADLPVLEAAGFLHDIGMIGLSKAIVGKRETEMTGEEKILYRAHPVQGELILSEIESLKPISRLVRHHHEQINGKGFPDGLKGETIPVLARIISAASIYDSLCHKRKVPIENIPEHLMMLKGYRIEPRLIDMLLEVNRQRIVREQNASVLELPIDELKEGMVLADHIRRPNGALVLSKDTRLSAFTIETLKRFVELAAIESAVSVYRMLP